MSNTLLKNNIYIQKIMFYILFLSKVFDIFAIFYFSKDKNSLIPRRVASKMAGLQREQETRREKGGL